MPESLYRPNTFRVGRAQEPQDNDPTFQSIRDAIEAGRKLHFDAKPFTKEPVAIWDFENFVAYLWFQGELFKRA